MIWCGDFFTIRDERVLEFTGQVNGDLAEKLNVFPIKRTLVRRIEREYAYTSLVEQQGYTADRSPALILNRASSGRNLAYFASAGLCEFPDGKRSSGRSI